MAEYEATPSTWKLYDALRLLEERAGVAPGEPFKTTRVAMIVESDLKPITLDCSLYILERDGIIAKDGKPGRGTQIRFLVPPLTRAPRGLMRNKQRLSAALAG